MKKYFAGIIALLMAVGFTAFKHSKFTDVTLIFQGSPTSTTDVANEEKYQQGSFSCGGDVRPCSIVTDMSNTKLIGPIGSQIRVLDDSKVTLAADPRTGGNYVPVQSGGSGEIEIENQN